MKKDKIMESVEFDKVKYVFSIILFIEYIFSVLMWNAGIYSMIPLLVYFSIYMTQTSIIEKLYINLFMIASLLIYFVIGKEFDFLPQAEALLNNNTNLLYWFSQGHVHAVRLLIAYPGYIISEWLTIGLDDGFGYYCIAIFLLFYRNIIEIIKKYIYNKKNALLYYAFSCVLVLALFCLMNGRIIFAFYGLSLILLVNMQLYNGIDFSLKHLTMMIIGLILTMVSSGTLVVGTANIICGIVFSNQLRIILRKKWVWAIGVFCLPMIYIFIKYLMAMINKNVEYFGGGFYGIINMLQHGLGRYLHIENTYDLIGIMLVGGLIVILNALIVIRWYILNSRILPIILSFNISIYGSLFGLSTGTTSIIGIILVFFYAIEKIQAENELRQGLY